MVIDPDCFAIAKDIMDPVHRGTIGRRGNCAGCARALKEMPLLLAPPASCCWTMPSPALGCREDLRRELFEFKKDYLKWIKLEYEETPMSACWSRNGTISTGLTPATEDPAHDLSPDPAPGRPACRSISRSAKSRRSRTPLLASLVKALKKTMGVPTLHRKDGFYQPHPDPNQERLFFNLLG